jgi:glucose-6-phosphate isomerase
MSDGRRGVLTNADARSLWERYRAYRYDAPELGFSLDVSRVRFEDGYLERMEPAVSRAMDAMEALEAGALANADEERMVGHYWLRAPKLAPTPEIRDAVSATVASIEEFAARVGAGDIRGADGPFENVVHVGIGGSAIGTQLLCGALARSGDPVTVHFVDNADPDGLDLLVQRLEGALGRTLVSVVSKSGWTPTTRHALSELEAVYARAGLDIRRHAVATTMEGTSLDELASAERWLSRFRIWEWVGGRFSVTSAVGLLPAALQGVDIRSFLGGAAAMDSSTRNRDARMNPAALLALMWYWLGNGRGDRRMVVVPYKDRLFPLVRYVQALAMESLGKTTNRSSTKVEQGLTVYGGRGSTDQHGFFQQLRDGTPDFFVTFVSVHHDRPGRSIEVAPGLTLGDHLFGYLEATRDALYARGRDSITMAIRDVSPASIGALVALFERAVGIYAELIDVNPYHQPGVVKDAARPVVDLQTRIVAQLVRLDEPATAEEIAEAIGRPGEVETVFKLLERLARDPGRGVASSSDGTPFGARFSCEQTSAQVASAE